MLLIKSIDCDPVIKLNLTFQKIFFCYLHQYYCFFLVKSILPSIYTVFSLLILSFYFFPLKYLLTGFKIDYSIHLVSDVIISISLVVMIIAYYLDSSRIMTLVFCILNFGFLVFLVFRSNSLQISKLVHRRLIINHLLTLSLLVIVS